MMGTQETLHSQSFAAMFDMDSGQYLHISHVFGNWFLAFLHQIVFR